MKGTRMLYTQAEFDTLIQNPLSSGYTNILSRADSILNEPDPKVNFTIYNPTGDQNDSQTNALSTDTQNIFLLAVAYKLKSSKTAYALKAQSLIENIITKITSVSNTTVIINGIPTIQYNMQGANTLPFFIPCMIFGADLVKSYGTTFNNTDFKNWLTNVVSVCSAKILDKYSPNNNNINIAWNTLDLAIAIYKYDGTESNDIINACRDYWKTLINTQIASSNIIPPLKDNDTDTDTMPIPFTILPQEIDRSDKYSIGTTSYFHSGTTQGIKGIHYTNFALMNFILMARLLTNKNKVLLEVVKATSTPTYTPEGQKLKDALITNALFVLSPSSSPYAYNLSKNGHTDFHSPNETSYMRLAVKVFGGETHEFINTVLTAQQQTYDRYLFIPILSKKWIRHPDEGV
jgi:hypothetical protein